MNRKIPYFISSAIIATFVAVVACAQAVQPPYVPPEFATSGNLEFDAWRKDFAARAVNAQNKDKQIIEAMLNGLSPNPDVTRLNESQPEIVRPVWVYINNAVSNSRVELGRQHLFTHGQVLGNLPREKGVPLEFAISIWAMESNYGANKGNMDVIRALSTFAYKGRRTALGESELLAVADMLKSGFATRQDLVGSWAGAMGHTQFMPSSFLSKAIDGDNDGKRDIWNNPNDALASTLNYLATVGWKNDEPWGREVSINANFDYSLADGQFRPLSFWREKGVVLATTDLPPDWQARLLVPAGANGPKFLVGANYNAIRHYNASDSYSLSVALLADRIAGGEYMPNNWPINDPPLGRSDVMELQNILIAQGLDVGVADGQSGTKTRRALQNFQQTHGMIADGYTSMKALQAVRLQTGAIAPPPAPTAQVAAPASPQNQDAMPVKMFGPSLKKSD